MKEDSPGTTYVVQKQDDGSWKAFRFSFYTGPKLKAGEIGENSIDALANYLDRRR